MKPDTSSGFSLERTRHVGFFAPATPTCSIVLGRVDYLAAARTSGSTLFTGVQSFNDGETTIIK